VGASQILTSPFRQPGTPTLTQPVEGATGVSPRPRIHGTAEVGARVHLFLDGAPYAWLQAGADGSFVLDLSTELAPGLHTVSTSAELLGIRSVASGPRSFQVAAPQADGGTTPDGGGTPDAGSETPVVQVAPILVVPAEGERVGPTPLFTGTATGGTWVSIHVDQSEVARVLAEADGRFRYLLTDAQALAFGVHRATVRTVDAAGASGPVSPPTSFEVGALNPEAGCGCGASSGAGLGVGALLLGLSLLRRRREAE
jgi:MYXO-CTERM domain-containing protein